MRVLVVGSGGREHALAWKLAHEAEVFACPGNPGIASVAECVSGDPLEVARKVRADLVVVGPENPLIQGLADHLRSEGFLCFGPGAAGARLEASKAFSKELMARAGVPTAVYGVFTEAAPAREFARRCFEDGRQLAVKASGAALGKGVVVAETLEEAVESIDAMLVSRDLGTAGDTIILEDRLVGREFSLLTLCSGLHYRSLPVAQDYKRALDGDRGPNTGGMGTYSPVPWLDEQTVQLTEETVVQPLLRLMAKEGIDYRGVLFSGLMVQDGVPMCLEYNVRFGDPETQSVMRLLGNGFVDALSAASAGAAIPAIDVRPQSAVTVVLASAGYPGAIRKGLPISIGRLPEGCMLFHAGTRIEDGHVVTDGGRVASVSAVANTLPEARDLAYAGVGQVSFEGAQIRNDIAANEPPRS